MCTDVSGFRWRLFIRYDIRSNVFVLDHASRLSPKAARITTDAEGI